MPSYSISYTSSSVRISVSGRGSYYCRFYCRTEIAGGSYTVIGDTWADADSMTFSGLSAGTTYVVNVAYSTSVNGSDTAWIGSQTFTTPVPVTGPQAYVYNGSAWVAATPYIYNGSTWVQAEPHVYDSGWS